MNDLIYSVNERPKKIYEWILYPLQMLLAVFVATVLISSICGTPIDSCLVGAAIGTLIYQVITRFKSPMFISSCGATCSAVIGALALNGGNNYFAVAIGGLIILSVYMIFAAIIHTSGFEIFDKLFPPIIVSPVTMLIGLNLAGFLPTYIGTSNYAMIVALVTMLVTAISSHYLKGFLKTISFLFGLIAGYITALFFTVIGLEELITFGQVTRFFCVPDFSFRHWGEVEFELKQLLDIALLFVPVSICAVLEHYSDHKALSNIIGKDLTKDPGMTKTLIGDGIASAIGTIICGLPNTSYGESVSTIGFSKVASVIITTLAAVFIGILGFIEPVRVFLQSIPSCAFGGSAMILYGYITISGLKTLVTSKTDLDKNKSVLVISTVLTIGVSGIYFISQSFAGIALAMVVGVVLNLTLKD